MLIRSSLIAALAVLCAPLTAEPDQANLTAGDAVGVEQEAPAAAARGRPGQQTRPPVVVGPGVLEATTSFACQNANGSTTTYTVSVEGGRCTTDGTATTRPSAAACRTPRGDVAASASCTGGCTGTSGSGSCTQTTTAN